jgi:hypothetical protein
MNRALVQASILAASGVTFSSHATVAASLSGISRAATEDTLIQKTQSGRCRAWCRECVIRWGLGGPGFHRCLCAA